MKVAIISKKVEYDLLEKACKSFGIETEHYPPSKVTGTMINKFDVTLAIFPEDNAEALLEALAYLEDKVDLQQVWACFRSKSHREYLESRNITRNLCPPSWSDKDLSERVLAELFLEFNEQDFQGIIGYSKPMQRLYKRLVKIAKSKESVLITGPTGSGKGHLAKALSRLAQKHMIKINIAELTDNLFESEVFGHAKGSFTDAITNRQGLLASAGDQLFFFDEIGELELTMQAKLLSVIEDKKVRPVGSNTFLDIDARFIFATNKDLKQMVKDGTFREDLYHRLEILSLDLPPLNDRRVDILILARALLANANPDLILDSEVKDALFDANWPGNVRQLDASLRRAAVFSDDTLDIMELRDILKPVDDKPLNSASLSTMTYKESQEYLRKTYFQQLLGQYSDRTQAIKHAGISKAQFYNLIKDLD